MQYNKKQFNKVNDKKIMKKVKKQWVVVSMASLAVLGGFAVSGTLSMTQPSSVVAHADDGTSDSTVQSKQQEEPQGETDQQKASDATKKDASSANNKASTNVDNKKGDAPYTPDHENVAVNSSGKSSTLPNGSNAGSGSTTQPQTSNNTQGPNQGAKNYEGASSNSTDNDGNQKDYDKTKDGFNDKLNNQNQDKSNSDKQDNTGKKDSYDYGAQLANDNKTIIDQGAQDAINGKVKDDQYKDNNYYNSSYDGSNQAKADYNNSINNQGTSDKDYTSYDNSVSDSQNNSKKDGGANTNSSSNISNDDHSGGADNPSDASNSAKNYDSDLKKQFNGTDANGKSTNSSVQNNDVRVPSDSNVSATTPQNTKLEGINADTYAYGYNYFLANQAAIDYESGKWKGTKASDNNGSNESNSQNDPTHDYYMDSQPDTKSAYYKGYQGAKTAAESQWTGNQASTKLSNTNGNISDVSLSENQFYKIGYNNVKNEINDNSTAFVSNGYQLDNLLSNNQVKSNVKIINDIDYSNVNGIASNNANYTTVDKQITPSGVINVNIDGQNHIADFKNMQYRFNPSDTNSQSSLSMNNFKTIYGNGYYGPVSFQTTNSTINYKNINYVGVQLISARTTKVNFAGKNNVMLVDSYHSPFTTNVVVNTPQQNIEASNMTLLPGASYYGDTNFQNLGGSDLVQVFNGGTLTLGRNSNMTLLTGGKSINNSSSGYNSGVYIDNSDSTMNLNKESNLNVIYNKDYNFGGNYGSGIYNNGNINSNGGNINIEFSGDSYGNNPLIINKGKINVTNNGLMQIKLSNANGSYSSGLLNASTGNQFNIASGNLIIDGSQNNQNPITLLNGSISVNDPGNKGILLKTNENGQLVSSGTMNTSTVAVDDNRNNKQLYYQYNVNANGTITGISGNGKTYNGSTKGKNEVSIYRAPSVSVSGPVNAKYNDDGTVTITGNLVVDRAEELDKNDNGIYLRSKADSNETNNTIQQRDFDDNTKYNNVIPNISNGTLVPFTQTVNGLSGKPDNVSTTIKYGIQGITINLHDKDDNYSKETIDAQSYSNNPGENGGVSPDGSRPIQILNSDNSYARRGIKDAINDKDFNSSNYKNNDLYNDNDLYANSYNSAIAGYEAYVKKPDNNISDNYNTTDDNSYKIAKDKQATEAFDQGYQAAQSNAGTNDYIAGQSKDKSNYNGNSSSYKSGYDEASNGYKDGAEAKNAVADASNGYTKGYVAGKGTSDYLSGKDKNSSSVDQTQNNNVNQDIYNNAYDSTKNGYNNTKDNQNTAYNYGKNMLNGMKAANGNKGFNEPSDKDSSDYQAYNDGKNAYNGMNDALTGQNKGKNEDYKSNNDEYNSAYEAAQKGLTDSSNNPEKYTNPSPQYSAYEAGQAARKGSTDAQADSYSNRPSEDSFAQKAYDNAKGNFNAGAGRSNGASTPDTNSQAYKDGLAAQAGQQAATKGDKNGSYPNNSDGSTYNDTQRTAYDNAKKAYNKGLTGDNTTGDAKADQAANNAGMSAKDGIDDAFSNGNPSNDDKQKGPDTNSYDAAKRAAEDGMNGQAKSNLDKQQQNAYDNGKAMYDGMQAAKQDNTNGLNHGELKQDKSSAYSNSYTEGSSQHSNYDKAYTAYKDGLAKIVDGKNENNDRPGQNPISDGNQNPNESTVPYQIAKDSETTDNAIHDAIYHTNTYRPSNNDKNQLTVYNQAQDAYNAGLTQQSNQSSVDHNQGYAYNVGKDALKGIQDAENGQQNEPGNPNDQKDSQDKNTTYNKEAYDQAQNDFKDGNKERNKLSSSNDHNTVDTSASLAYQTGQKYEATKSGIDKYVNNEDGPTLKNNDYSKTLNNGYNAYKAGYEGSNNGQPTETIKSDPSQMDAYNQGRAAQAAVKDASSGKFGNDGSNRPLDSTQPNSSKNSSADSMYNSDDYKPSGADWTTNQQTAYDNAYEAYLDGKKSPNSGSAPNGQKVAYNKGQGDGQLPEAINDAINGKTGNGDNDYSNNIKNFNYSLENSNKDSNSDDIHKAVDIVNKAISDAKTTGNMSDGNLSPDQKNYYDNAFNAYQYGFGKNSSDSSITTDNEKNNSIPYQIGLAARKGIQDTKDVNGKTSYDKNGANQVEKDAYTYAQSAYKSGLTGNPQPNNSTQAFNEGQSDKSGIDAAIRGDSEPKDDSTEVSKVAYDATKAGLNNQNNAQNNYANNAGKAYQSGLSDAQSTDNPDNSGKDLNKDHQSEYNQAKKDYQDGLSAQSGNVNSNGYGEGLNDRAVKQGVKDASNGVAKEDGSSYTPVKQVDGKDINNVDNQINAYKNAVNGFDYGYGNKSIDKDNSAYQSGEKAGKDAKQAVKDQQSETKSTDAKSDSYNQAQQNYQDGFNNPKANGDDLKKFNSQSDAFKQGQNDKNAIDSALNGKEDHSDSPAYKAAKAGLAGNESYDNNYQAAHDIGQAANQGINDSLNGTPGKTQYVNEKDKTDAYNNAEHNFDMGLADKTDDKTSESSDAYKAGQAAKDGYKDAEANKGDFNKTSNVDNYNGNPFAKDSYDNAQAAYKAGLAGNDSNADAKKNSVANKAGLDAKQGIADAIKGQTDPTAVQSEDYNNAFNAAKAGNNVDNANKSAADAKKDDQSTAYQAGQAAQKGIADVQTGTGSADQYKDNSAAQSAYSDAKQAYNDGLNGGDSKQASKDNPTANAAGQAARQGMIDAQSGNGKNNPYTDNPQKDAYNKAKQAFDKGLNGNDDADNPVANEAGKAARQAAADAQVGKNDASPYNNNSNAHDAYQRAMNAYNDGFNSDKDNASATKANDIGKAARQGMNDAENGKDNSDSYNSNPDAKAAYDNAKKAYQAGINGDTTSADAKGNPAVNKAGYANFVPFSPKTENDNNNSPKPNAYQEAQNAAKQKNSNEKAAAKDAVNALINGKSKFTNSINLANKSPEYRKAFKKAYDQSKAGFDAGKKGHYSGSYDSSYQEGYKAGKKQFVKNTNDGKQAGKQAASKLTKLPSFKNKSQAYADAYKEAFKKEVKYNTPHYVYNLKKVYSHNNPSMTRKTRENKYAKTAMYKRETFKITGYKINDKGQLVYKTSKGWISADKKSFNDVYYRHDNQNTNSARKSTQKIRVIKPQGTYIYNSKNFNKKTAVKNMRKGTTLEVKSVEQLGHITRFYLGNGQYISSNKTIVEKINKK
ncbi:DUF5776 domain-containing protein [Apilactobacillus apisilvae]|uniref:DUF5776 domain-containing protein n=1 Tax=Apilactobacillus apisilvae TaxID=2923364 RepID=A0ABY4PHF6_9LACO|nr:DUF5776 domain-containing protein [Apilactobacillus apisilvae]UQS84930.1 DUF5776 domain-containing protein [Apilactobacillus apisilvae]